jgi:hypothetical protein
VIIFTDIYQPAAGCSSTHTNNSPLMREEANGSCCKRGFLDAGRGRSRRTNRLHILQALHR